MTWKCIVGLLIVLALSPGSAGAEMLFSFDGSVDFQQQLLSVTIHLQDNNAITAEVDMASAEHFGVKVVINHLRIRAFDISTELDCALEVMSGENEVEPFLCGTVRSRYSLINYKPVQELSGYFKIQGGRLYLESVQWGSFFCDGYIGLSLPRDVKLALKFDDARASDISVLMGCSGEEAELSGTIRGTLNISGFLDRAVVAGQLTAYDGFLGVFEYDVVRLNFEGLYPTVQVSDSSFTGADGLSFNLQGSVDLRESCDFQQGVSSLRMSPLVYERGDVSEWTIRRREEENSVRRSELKYRVRQHDTTGMSLEEDDGMLGVEGSIQF